MLLLIGYDNTDTLRKYYYVKSARDILHLVIVGINYWDECCDNDTYTLCGYEIMTDNLYNSWEEPYESHDVNEKNICKRCKTVIENRLRDTEIIEYD